MKPVTFHGGQAQGRGGIHPEIPTNPAEGFGTAALERKAGPVSNPPDAQGARPTRGDFQMRIITDIRIRFAAAILAAVPAVVAPPASAAGSIPVPITTNVTVTNPSLPVRITNGTLNVHSVDSPTLTSFAENSTPVCAAAGASYSLGTPGAGNGQVFVLEMVSVQFFLPAGTFPKGVVIGTQSSSTGPNTVAIPATLQGSDGVSNYYVASQAMKVYSVGTAVTVSIDAGKGAGYSGTPNVCISNFGISGYTVSSQ